MAASLWHAYTQSFVRGYIGLYSWFEIPVELDVCVRCPKLGRGRVFFSYRSFVAQSSFVLHCLP